VNYKGHVTNENNPLGDVRKICGHRILRLAINHGIPAKKQILLDTTEVNLGKQNMLYK